MIRESAARSQSGMFMLVLFPALILLDFWWLFATAMRNAAPLPIIAGVLAIVILSMALGGFFVVEPSVLPSPREGRAQ